MISASDAAWQFQAHGPRAAAPASTGKPGAAGRDPLTAAKEFESVFLSNFLSTMFSGLSTEAPFGGGSAEETWRGFLVKEYADGIVEAGGIGIADHVYRQLVAVQEEASR